MKNQRETETEEKKQNRLRAVKKGMQNLRETFNVNQEKILFTRGETTLFNNTVSIIFCDIIFYCQTIQKV